MQEKKIDNLIINKVENQETYEKMKTQGLINNDELYLVGGGTEVTSVNGQTGDVTLTADDVGALSANDSSIHTHSNKSVLDGITSTKTSHWDTAYIHSQSAHAPSDAEKNIITGIQKNGTAVTPINRVVNITVPTKTSDLTNDSDLATNASVDTKLDDKVDKVSGKGLSTNDLTTALKTQYDAAYTHSQTTHAPANAEQNVIVGIKRNGTALTTDSSRNINIVVPTKTSELTNDSNYLTSHQDISGKVDKVDGKGLSTNDYTTAEKTKLAGVAEGANNYSHPTYTAKSSGLYKITVNNLGHVSATTAVTKADITNLGIPAQDTTYTLPVATSNVLGGVKSGGDFTVDSTGTVTITHQSLADYAKSADVTTALNGKANSSHTHTIANVTNLQSTLDAKVPTSRTVNGKALSANITLTASDVGALPSTTTIPSIDGLATETYVDNKIKTVVGSAPEALDTLKELADALGNDKDFSATVTNSLANKVDKVTGKGLSTNDLTSTLKSNYDAAYTHSQSVHAPSNAERNTIVGITVNGTDATINSSTRKISLTIPSAITESTVSGWGFTKNTGTYSKPSGGIPKTDLASAVQTSLGKADTALQSLPDHTHAKITDGTTTFEVSGKALIASTISTQAGGPTGGDTGNGTNIGSDISMFDNGYFVKLTLDGRDLQGVLDTKVSTETGKGLSTNDYTTAEKTKLAGIATNANNYSHPTYTVGSTTSTASPTHGGTFTAIDSITTNNLGHVTSINTKTVTLPSDNNTLGKNVIGTAATSTSNGAVTGNGVYLNHIEGTSTVKSTHKITGAGATKVISDANGNITITSTDSDTVYTHPTYTRTNNTSKASPAHGETFTAIDSITTNTLGHVTAVNTKTVTLPSVSIPSSIKNPNALTFTGASTASYDGSAAVSVNIPTVPSSLKNPNALTVKLNSGTTEGTNLFTYDGSAVKSINITPSAIGAAASSHTHTIANITNLQTTLDGKAASSHTHNYAGSSSAGGAANSVKTNLIIKLNSGTTEGTNLFTFNGSTAKTVNITASAIGAMTSSDFVAYTETEIQTIWDSISV